MDAASESFPKRQEGIPTTNIGHIAVTQLQWTETNDQHMPPPWLFVQIPSFEFLILRSSQKHLLCTWEETESVPQ